MFDHLCMSVIIHRTRRREDRHTLIRHFLRIEEENSVEMGASAILIMEVEFDMWWFLVRGLHIIADRTPLAGETNFLMRVGELEGFRKLGEVFCSLYRETTEQNCAIYLFFESSCCILKDRLTYAGITGH